MIHSEERFTNAALKQIQHDLAVADATPKTYLPDRFLSLIGGSYKPHQQRSFKTFVTQFPPPTKLPNINREAESGSHDASDVKLMSITAPALPESTLPPQLARSRIRGVPSGGSATGNEKSSLLTPPISGYSTKSAFTVTKRSSVSSSSSSTSSFANFNSSYPGTLSSSCSSPASSAFSSPPNSPLGVKVEKKNIDMQPPLPHVHTQLSTQPMFLSQPPTHAHMQLPPSNSYSHIAVQLPLGQAPVIQHRPQQLPYSYSFPPQSAVHNPPIQSMEAPPVVQPVIQHTHSNRATIPIASTSTFRSTKNNGKYTSTSPYSILPEKGMTSAHSGPTGRVGKQPVRDPEKLKDRIWLQQNRMHQDKLHQLGFRILEGTNGTKICSLCNVSFSKEMFVWRHAWQHVTEKPFHCNVCRQKFTRSDTLQRHVRRTGHSLTTEVPIPQEATSNITISN